MQNMTAHNLFNTVCTQKKTPPVPRAPLLSEGWSELNEAWTMSLHAMARFEGLSCCRCARTLVETS